MVKGEMLSWQSPSGRTLSGTQKQIDNWKRLASIGSGRKKPEGAARVARQVSNFYGTAANYPTQKSANISDDSVAKLTQGGIYRLLRGAPPKITGRDRGAFKTAMRRVYTGKGGARRIALEFNDDQARALKDYRLLLSKGMTGQAKRDEAAAAERAYQDPEDYPSYIRGQWEALKGVGSEGRLTSRQSVKGTEQGKLIADRTANYRKSKEAEWEAKRRQRRDEIDERKRLRDKNREMRAQGILLRRQTLQEQREERRRTAPERRRQAARLRRQTNMLKNVNANADRMNIRPKIRVTM